MGTAVVARDRRVVDVVGIVVVVLGLLGGLVPGIVLAPADAVDLGDIGPGGFEIDGDVTVDGAPGSTDWDGVGGEQVPDGTGGGDTSWFEASTKESDYPGWSFVTGANANKADLHRLFVQTQTSAAGNYVWLAATRVSDRGNVQVTVEFNQDGLQVSDLTGAYRQVGDFLVRFNFPGGRNADVDVFYAVWDGAAWVNERELVDGSGFRAAKGTIGGRNREFVELEIDLDLLFGEDPFFAECRSFGSAAFRTESSGGNNDNNDPTLKDVGGPFPIDLDTCAEVTVVKVDDDGAGLAGVALTLFEGGGVDGAVYAGQGATNPCTTDATGTCSFGVVQPGTYTIDETVVPAGYRRAPGLPETFVVVEDEPVELGPYTDPRIPYAISVEPDGSNAVGNDHVFTVVLTADGGPLADATVDLSWDGVGDGIVDVDGTALVPGRSSTTCTTDAAGECEVTVASDVPGRGALTASVATPYQHAVAADGSATTADGTGGTVPLASIADDATKTWTGYHAGIAPDGLNLVGQAHTFTVSVVEVDGTTPDVPAANVLVALAWDEGSAAGSSLDTTTCRTDASGTCTVVAADGGTPGRGTVSIVALDGVVGDGEQLTVAFDAGEVAAVKTWREYRARIDDDSVNPAGEAHAFTVAVDHRDGPADEWTPAPDGTTVAWTLTGDGDVDRAASSCDDGTDGGVCTIVVGSTGPGIVTVTVTAVAGALLGDAGSPAETFDVVDVAATKTWLDVVVDVAPDGRNLVGEDHTWTVAVRQSDGGAYRPVPDGTVVAFELSDGGDSLVSETCSTGTADGVCEIVVGSTAPGVVTVLVTGVAGFDGFDVPADVVFAVPGRAEKQWFDHRASIEADGVNLVGDAHTFTVTAEVDGGDGWEPVADGTVVTVTATGLAADVDQSDCADGTTDGTCEVVATSADPGTVTVTVDTVENRDATDSDVEFVDVADGRSLDGDRSVSADKTWFDHRAWIEADAVNLTGDAHVLTVTAQQDDGSGWSAVPDGTTVGVAVAGVDTVVASTCTDPGTVAGSCTVTLDSDDVATTTVTVTTVEALAVDGQPTAAVDDDTLDDGQSRSATKTWVELDLSVTPDETNVVGDDHVFTVVVDVVTPAGTFPVGDGATVEWSVEGGAGTGVVSDTCDTQAAGTVGGECTVTVGSTEPGTLVLTVDRVTFEALGDDLVVDLGDDSVSGEGTIDRTAVKTWRDYRTSIAADGLNLVGDEHDFVVTVEQTDDGDVWSPVPDGTVADVSITGVGAVTVDDCGDTGTTDGSCLVTVDSAAPGTATVTVGSIDVAHPATDVVVGYDTEDAVGTKTWIALRPRISADAVNVTGDDHDFTLAVDWTADGTTWIPVPDGSTIDHGSSGVGAVVGDDCDDTSAGGCTVTVSSDVGGQRSVEVLGATVRVTLGDLDETFRVAFVEGGAGTLAGLVDAHATKTWASYALALTPLEAVNLLDGSDDDPERLHVVTATLSSDDAVNASVAEQPIEVVIGGTTGVVASVEEGTVAPDGSSATCVTDTDGTCDVTIRSTVAGTASLDASYTATVGESAPVTVEAVPASKVWTTFRVTVTPERATNLVGDPHVFSVRVEQSSPAGDCDDDWCPVEGVSPTISMVDSTGAATVDEDLCASVGTGADGTCTVTVGSDEVTALTLTAVYEASVGQTVAAFSDAGAKSWIDHEVVVTPDVAENLVGTDHTFTVRVMTVVPAADTVVMMPVAGAVPTLDLTGPGSIVSTTCGDGTDRYGECTVVISAAVPGASTLTATFVGSAEGVAGGTDEDGSRAYVDSGRKLWVDYFLVLDDDATNAVGDDHTFTATLTRDTGAGPVPVVGAVVDVAPLGGVGELVGETCTAGTDEQGRCTVTVASDRTGTTTVAVSHEGVAGDTTATFADEAVKTWVDIALVKEAVVAVDGGGSDLELKDGLPTLTFVDTDPSATSAAYDPQTAVYEFTITNTGPVALHDVTLVDDRIGVVLDGSEGITLAPGASVTERASETFTREQAVDGLVVNTGVVSGTTDDGVTVEADDDAVVQLVTQLDGLLDVTLTKRALTGTGDLRADPDVGASAGSVEWFGDEVDADATKRIPYEFVVTNTGGTPLTNIVLTDDKIGTVLDGTEGITLAAGESYAVVVNQDVTLSEVFALLDEPDVAFDLSSAQQANSYANAGLLRNTATVTSTDDLGDPGPTATDDELVRVVVLKDVVTGFDQGSLLVLALVLLALGALVLAVGRRPGSREV